MKNSMLAVLREKALTETDFSRFWDYFLDHFAPDEFLAAAKPVEDSFLLQIAALVWHQCSGKPVAVHRLTLVEIPETGIVHGSGWLDSSPVILLYFPDPGVGMLAVTDPDGKGTKFVRFSTEAVWPAKPGNGGGRREQA